MSSKKPKQYLLLPTEIIVKEEGISMYKVIREGDFPEELMDKYFNDVHDLLDAKLDKFVVSNNVSEKEIQRIKDLIDELIKVTDLKHNCADEL